MRESVVIVGAGMAGLSAALELSRSHSVTVVEARQRVGGRVHTLYDEQGIPFELGAEFIHGNTPETWHFIREARLLTQEAPDRHWKHHQGTMLEIADFWDQLASITEGIEPGGRDMSFSHFIARQKKPVESLNLAKDFIEGFHAAPLERASIQATRLTEESSEEIDGDRQFRITRGYEQLVRYVQNSCCEGGVRFHMGAPVLSVDWSGRSISVRMQHDKIDANRVIITLPLGVLKSGALAMHPRPAAKFAAINALEMGVVTKVALHFKKRFWPEPNFGFIHSDDQWFPTWWSDERADILTAWAGGPRGEKLAKFERAFVIERAVEGVSKLFGESLPNVQKGLLQAHTHNWLNDPFSLGAYSYIPVNGPDACREIARPEEGRLFFAGEATDLNYQFGTVHGAIASGFRAARQIKEASRKL